MAEEPIQNKHSSDLLPWQTSPEQWAEIQKEFAEASEAKERVQGIVFMCGLDDALERLLRTVMIDDKSVDELMDDGQALQSFSSKLRLAYALGLIPKAVERDLYFLNKIRNAFAHEARVTSFDTSPVCDLCGNLSTAKIEDGTPVSAHRMAAFENSCYLKSEIDRRAKKRASGEGPPANWAESVVLACRDRQNREGK